MGEPRYIDIACTYEHHTADAVLVDTGDGEQQWIPRSLLRDAPPFVALTRGKLITLDVQEWWAKKEGLI